MSGSRRIIVGTSGSPGSLQALRYAAGLAREDDATLIPVLAWLPPGGDMADRRTPGYLRQIWKDAAWLRLWTALDMAWGGIAPAGRPAEPLVRRGEPGRCWSRRPASQAICWWSARAAAAPCAT